MYNLVGNVMQAKQNQEERIGGQRITSLAAKSDQ